LRRKVKTKEETNFFKQKRFFLFSLSTLLTESSFFSLSETQTEVSLSSLFSLLSETEEEEDKRRGGKGEDDERDCYSYSYY